MCPKIWRLHCWFWSFHLLTEHRTNTNKQLSFYLYCDFKKKHFHIQIHFADWIILLGGFTVIKQHFGIKLPSYCYVWSDSKTWRRFKKALNRFVFHKCYWDFCKNMQTVEKSLEICVCYNSWAAVENRAVLHPGVIEPGVHLSSLGDWARVWHGWSSVCSTVRPDTSTQRLKTLCILFNMSKSLEADDLEQVWPHTLKVTQHLKWGNVAVQLLRETLRKLL